MNGIPVLDCVIHVYDMSAGNIRADESTSENAREHLVRLQPASRRAPGSEAYPSASEFNELTSREDYV